MDRFEFDLKKKLFKMVPSHSLSNQDRDFGGGFFNYLLDAGILVYFEAQLNSLFSNPVKTAMVDGINRRHIEYSARTYPFLSVFSGIVGCWMWVRVDESAFRSHFRVENFDLDFKLSFS
jgi:hypothetical protein